MHGDERYDMTADDERRARMTERARDLYARGVTNGPWETRGALRERLGL